VQVVRPVDQVVPYQVKVPVYQPQAVPHQVRVPQPYQTVHDVVKKVQVPVPVNVVKTRQYNVYAPYTVTQNRPVVIPIKKVNTVGVARPVPVYSQVRVPHPVPVPVPRPYDVVVTQQVERPVQVQVPVAVPVAVPRVVQNTVSVNVDVPVARPIPRQVPVDIVHNVDVPVLVGNGAEAIAAPPVHHDDAYPNPVPYAPKPPPDVLYIKGVSPHRNIQNPFPTLTGDSSVASSGAQYAPSGTVVQNGNQYGR